MALTIQGIIGEVEFLNEDKTKQGFVGEVLFLNEDKTKQGFVGSIYFYRVVGDNDCP